MPQRIPDGGDTGCSIEVQSGETIGSARPAPILRVYTTANTTASAISASITASHATSLIEGMVAILTRPSMADAHQSGR